jgi:hypothetical protein
MATNVLGTLNVPELVLTAFQYLKQKLPVLSTITTDMSDQAVLYNQTVISRVVTPPAVQNYDPVNGYVATAADTVDIDVTLNNFKHVSVAFTDDVISSTSRNLIQEQVSASMYSLVLQVVTDVLSLVTPANFIANAPIHVSTGGITRAVVVAARQELVLAGATDQRYGIVSPVGFGELSTDPTVFSTFQSQKSGSVLNEDAGSIQGLAGFGSIVEVNQLPTGTLAYFGGKEALLLVTRVPKDPAGIIPGVPIPGSIETVVDTDTGLSIQSRLFYLPLLGRYQLTFAIMYGFALGMPSHGLVIEV